MLKHLRALLCRLGFHAWSDPLGAAVRSPWSIRCRREACGLWLIDPIEHPSPVRKMVWELEMKRPRP